ncbi:hypothetical protein Slala02_04130 [Streptomyces lavendulae subsp. lavendulae]|nr:hypothetical protein Slala01_11900 [Streptomyces lavendulae subsp. lavendulae]GLX24593.1 hypothetical protein Slala02_04130 [Streptomyces lavendulae subsp. lavendulae]
MPSNTPSDLTPPSTLGTFPQVRRSDAEAAGNNALPLIFLPLISSAFVPVHATPGWFQPAIETLRGLLLGTEIGNNWWIALLWCLGPPPRRGSAVHAA